MIDGKEKKSLTGPGNEIGVNQRKITELEEAKLENKNKRKEQYFLIEKTQIITLHFNLWILGGCLLIFNNLKTLKTHLF